jgi:hypothetical protein
MGFLGVKLTDEEKRNLEELAGNRGMTVSDVIRDMIRNDDSRRTLTEALQEIKTLVGNLAAQRGSSNDKDIAEIRRIVTLIARAMPSVARHVP